jgi:hypothetical protein
VGTLYQLRQEAAQQLLVRLAQSPDPYSAPLQPHTLEATHSLVQWTSSTLAPVPALRRFQLLHLEGGQVR